MTAWETITIQVLATGGVVALVLYGFWVGVVRPHLDRKVAELIAAADKVEANVRRGVRHGVAESLRELPESALDGPIRDSTRQFLKFGSGLFENGLSSFLGSAADLERKSASGHRRDQPRD